MYPASPTRAAPPLQRLELGELERFAQRSHLDLVVILITRKRIGLCADAHRISIPQRGEGLFISDSLNRQWF
jgi:hypothetical protein